LLHWHSALDHVADLERPMSSATKKRGTALFWGTGSTIDTCAVQNTSQAGYAIITTANLSTLAKEESINSLGADNRLPAAETQAGDVLKR